LRPSGHSISTIMRSNHTTCHNDMHGPKRSCSSRVTKNSPPRFKQLNARFTSFLQASFIQGNLFCFSLRITYCINQCGPVRINDITNIV
jgi:hypothetical protein